MNAIEAFPRRPVQLTPYGASLRPRIWPILAFIGFQAMFLFALYYYAPAVVDDYRLPPVATPASRATLEPNGKCTTTRGILTSCDLDVTYMAGNQRLTQPLHYLDFVQTVDDSVPLQIAYDPADPTHLTTNWGRGMLLNRAIMLGVILALALLLLWYAIFEMRRRMRVRKAARAIGADGKPVAARFIKVQTARNIADVSFAWTDPLDGKERQASTRMGRGMQPFWLDTAKTAMLALAHPGGGAQLLDGKLATVSLTPEERQAVLRTAIPAA